MDAELIRSLMQLQAQLQLTHWCARTYRRHKAYGGAYGELSSRLDELVEVWLGLGNVLPWQRVALNLTPAAELNDSYLEVYATQLEAACVTESNGSVKNLLEGITGGVNRLRYLNRLL